MAPKPSCPKCGSKKWKKKSGTGSLSCECGYIMQDHRNETSEAIDFGQHTMRKRTLKSMRATKDERSRGNPILYHGDRARFHYFQCLQVLLRMQIKKITELWDLPNEFETICRDTWALHLSLLTHPPPPEPFLHSQDQDNSQGPALTGQDKPSQEKTERERDQDEAENVSEPSDAESSSAPDDGDKDSSDSDMDELLREASEVEFSDSDGEQQGGPSTGKAISRKRVARWRRDDTPAATICVLVHSCWLLRIPVIYKDFISLIETYTLPYLDPVRLLPPSLTRHLTKYAKQALSPHYAPTPILLHTITSRLSRLYFERYGIFTPELNTAPILWRSVRRMGGTPSLYAVSKTLARYLELPLALNPVLVAPLFKQTSKDPNSHKSDNVPPEVALVATVVVALKMIYGFGDGKQVTPWEDWDPAHTMPALEVYMDHLQALDATGIESRRRCFSQSSMFAETGTTDMQDADEQSLDAYLEFCERALLGRTGRDSKAEKSDLVAEYFPLHRSSSNDRTRSVVNATLSAEGTSHGDVRTATPGLDDELKRSKVRCGESYTIYSAQDVLGMVSEQYGMVLNRAARWVGVSSDDLSGVIERFERRLIWRWQRNKRMSKAKNESESETESDK